MAGEAALGNGIGKRGRFSGARLAVPAPSPYNRGHWSPHHAAFMPAALVERPLIVSPSLAATIGLEGALLYQLLADWQQMQGDSSGDGLRWQLIDKARLQQLLPFWELATIEQQLRQLQEQGLIIIGAGLMGNANNIRFALATPRSSAKPTPATAAAAPAQTQAPTQAKAPAPQSPGGPRRESGRFSGDGATTIDGNWQPDRESLEYLTRFHGVDRDFINSVLPEFIAHWRDSGETRVSWNSTFTAHVSKRWKKYRYQRAEEARTVQLPREWQPSEDAVQILHRSGIAENFIWDAVPEFVLYWQERGTYDRNWNSRFIEHVRRQWARYTNAMGGDTELTRISADWQPGDAVFDILHMANIDSAFARELIPEFVLYWTDSGQLQRSWNSKFLQHVKYQWAKRHQLEPHYERQQQVTGKGSREAESFIEKHTDRSWREGL